MKEGVKATSKEYRWVRNTRETEVRKVRKCGRIEEAKVTELRRERKSGRFGKVECVEGNKGRNRGVRNRGTPEVRLLERNSESLQSGVQAEHGDPLQMDASRVRITVFVGGVTVTESVMEPDEERSQ